MLGIQRLRMLWVVLGTVVVAGVFLLAAARGGIPLGGATGSPGQSSFSLVVVTPGTFGLSATPGIVVISGDGTFSPGGASAHGSWTIFSGPPVPANFVSGGAWVAIKMLGFVSYGIVSPRAEGGNLTLLVDIHTDGSAKVAVATLQITCKLGSPPAGVFEGASLVGPGMNFLHPFVPPNGDTLFAPSGELGTAMSPLALASFRTSIGACNLGCC